MEWTISLIIASSTLLLVVLTGIYVIITHKLLQETKRTADETHRPEVVLFLTLEKRQANQRYYLDTFLCVQNVGTRAARRIWFDGDFSFKPAFSSSLKNINFLRNGIEVLVSGQKMSAIVSSVVGRLDELHTDDWYKNKQSRVKFDVTYQNIRGTEYSDNFQLDFREISYF